MLSPTLIWHGRYDISGNEGFQWNDKMAGASDVRRKNGIQMVYKSKNMVYRGRLLVYLR